MIRKKNILFVFMFLFLTIFSFPSEKYKQFKEYILNKNYKSLSKLFSDNSYEKIIRKIGIDKILVFKNTGGNSFEITIINNKSNIGKTFLVNYEESDGGLKNLIIYDILSKFFIFKGFDSSLIHNTEFSIADTLIKIEKAIILKPKKLANPLLFYGKIKLIIKPKDIEEEKQFIHLFGHNYKVFKPEWIIYYSNKPNLFKKNIIKKSISFNNKFLIKSFNNFFTFHLQGIKNHSFFLLPDKNENLIIFPTSSKKIMIYSNNKNRVPDTQLYGFNFKKILLDYNYYKIPKFIFGDSSSKIKSINLKLNLHNKDAFVQLTAKEKIETKGNISKLTLELPNIIKINKLYSPDDFKLVIFNNIKNLYINGNEFRQIIIKYKLKVEKKEDFDLNYSSKKLNVFNTYILDKRFNNILFLSRDSNYYLKDKLSFIKFHLNVDSGKLRCFSAGEEIDKNEFKSDAVKGFPLICGHFLPIKNKNINNINNTIKINYYSNFIINNMVLKDIMKSPRLFNFYTQIYGQLDYRKINIIMSENSSLSALSYKGLIYINIPWDMFTFNYGNSPVKFRNDMLDIISHEIAHQWWGGLISWKTYRDIWITEGFANLSTILYLKKEFGENEFNKIVKKMNKTVIKKHKYGPIAYGKRVGNWEEDTNSYFSIIYNKSALVLLMLKEIMGENLFLNK
jgi:hypothetical protein